MPLAPGAWVQRRYTVDRALGSGGSATAHLVWDEVTASRVVLKELHAGNGGLIRALRSEFTLLKSLEHPRLLRVLDFGSELREAGTRLDFYTAEYLRGSTLEAFAKGARFEDVLSALRDVMEGLSVLHRAGFRHGDLTSRNVIVDEMGRAKIIDFGCARPFSLVEDSVSGTLGSIAPELTQTGAGDARSDLYSFGICLKELDQQLEGGLPHHVQAMVERLSRPDPAERPTDILEVCECLRWAPPRTHLFGKAVQMIGREQEVERFREFLANLGNKQSDAPRALWVEGEVGSGKSRLLAEFRGEAQLECDVVDSGNDTGESFTGFLRRASENSKTQGIGAVLALVERARSLTRPMILFVDDADELDLEERLLLNALIRSLDKGSELALVFTAKDFLYGEGPAQPTPVLAQMSLSPLSASQLRAWAELSLPPNVHAPLSESAFGNLHDYTGGLPALIELSLEQLEAGKLSAAELRTGSGGRAWSHLLDGKLADLGAQDITWLARATAGFGYLPCALWPELADAAVVERLCERRLLHRSLAGFALLRRGDIVFLSSRLASHLGAAHKEWAHRLQRTSVDGEPMAELVWHWWKGGEAKRAQQWFLGQKQHWSVAPRAWLAFVEPLASGRVEAALFLGLAELFTLAGQPSRSVSILGKLLRSRPSSKVRTEARVLAADAFLLLGRAKRAHSILVGVQRKGVTGMDARLADKLARVLLQRGKYGDAFSVVQAVANIGLEPGLLAKVHEDRGIAAEYLGQSAIARSELQSALTLFETHGSPRDRCRVLQAQGIGAFRNGEPQGALHAYSAALTLALDNELTDLIAVARLNLGTALQQLGDLGGALAQYEQGQNIARALGRESTELTLRYNLANLYADIGAFDRAEALLSSLEEMANGAKLEQFRGAIALTAAEALFFTGDLARARERLEVARQSFAARGELRQVSECTLLAAEFLLASGALPEVQALLATSLADSAIHGHKDLSARRDRIIGLLLLERTNEEALAKLEGALSLAQQAAQPLLEALLETDLSIALVRLGDPARAQRFRDKARNHWDTIARNLTAPLRDVFWRHPRRRVISDLTTTFAVQVPRAGDSEVLGLRRLLSLTRRLNSTLSVPALLDYALDSALELTGAERGFILLVGAAEQDLSVVAARHLDQAKLAHGAQPSLNIARRTVETELPIITVEADLDGRFMASGSVHEMRLKAVLCVPIASPSGVLGALYLDSRKPRARFTEADLQLLSAFADQVAVALGNARLLDELGRQSAEISEQKRALERLSKGQARQIEQLKQEVAQRQQVLEQRFDYSRIIGRSPVMKALFDKLDRVIDTDVGMLIQGESGTGKELVAQAVHYNSPRKAGPFVGVNCAALPEHLLESELFGHIKGAFTGALRDKEGLFFAASGGTLFLDEIGEMPLAIQAKLLRVLQEREVRPVGGSRSIPLNFRLICATNRDLQREVEQGRFREDLYYRVGVVDITLPPLRERILDIPEISSSILSRLAKDTGREPKTLTTEALERLLASPWPGNVRQLENMLTRAFFLSPTRELGAECFAPEKRTPKAPSRDRGEYQQHEREQIQSALAAAKWNIASVSRTLGIPRNSLYRKLRKYRIEAPNS